MKEIKIHTEYIKLAQLLKLAGAVAQGSDAKHMIEDGVIKVNGEICFQRGKKLYDGDTVEIEGKDSLKVCI